MGAGTVLRFDEARGFGFIEADDGGADVFVHASALDCDERAFVRGARVAFDAMRSDRGRRATVVRVLGQKSVCQPSAPAPALTVPAQPVPQQPLRPQSPVAASSSAASPGPAEERAADECDLLSAAEFERELTDVLLDAGAELTAARIVLIRSRLLESAIAHGWVEN